MKNGYAGLCSVIGTGALIVVVMVVGGERSVRAGNDAADEALATIRPEAIRADMQFLADDLLEGRATGARGHEIAAKFMAAEFESMGLDPAGENGTYFQNVSLRSFRADEERTTLTLVRGEKVQALAFRQDFVTIGDPGPADTAVEAPVVYVGFGVTAPDQNYETMRAWTRKEKSSPTCSVRRRDSKPPCGRITARESSRLPMQSRTARWEWSCCTALRSRSFIPSRIACGTWSFRRSGGWMRKDVPTTIFQSYAALR